MGDEPSGTAAVPASDASSDATKAKSWWRREIRYFIEIAAVAGFAVAQPLLSSFGDSPETFVTMGASRLSIVAFALELVTVPAFLVWAVVALMGLARPGVRQAAQGVAVGLFVTLLLQWALHGLASGLVLTALAVGLGGLVAVAYPRLAALRLYLSFASVAPVAFLVLFIVSSSVTPLVFAPDAIQTEAAAGADQPSVVVLVLDELPTASLLDADNQIDAELFPNIARLADDSSFYRNNTTVATHTDAALPAIMTGRYPTDVNASRRDYAENIFNLVGKGYDVNALEAVTALCTRSECERPIVRRALKPLSKRAWRLWSDLLTGTSRRPTGVGPVLQELQRDRFDKPDQFIDSLEAVGDRPRLDFGHLLLPHQLWQTLPDGHQYASEIPYASALGDSLTSVTGAQLARQRHLLQVQYTDRVVGEVLDRLEELDRYDDSYVILMADHGVAFEKDEEYRGPVLNEKTKPAVMWTPLFVKKPGQTKGNVSDENSQTIDVVPTLADALSIDIPWDVDGRSLLGSKPLAPDDKRYLPGNSKDGKTRAFDGQKGFERMLALPPASAVSSSDPLALYRLPPHTGLTGTPVDELPKGPPIDVSMRLDDPARFENVDLDRTHLPVYIGGDIDAAAKSDARLVISVNGVIGGWGAHETNWMRGDWRTEARFGVMVPPSLLREGRNEIEVFAMTGEPGSVTLHDVNLG